MYNAPTGYRDAIEAMDRKVSIIISLGTDLDETSSDDVTSITADSLPLSNHGQIIDSNYELSGNFATYEAYGIPTALSAGMIVPPIDTVAYPPEVGLWSDDISDEDGYIDWTISIVLSQEHTSGFTIYTEEVGITEGTAVFTDANQQTETVALVPRSGLAVAPGVHTYQSIEIHVTRLQNPYQHARITEIEFGDFLVIDEDRLAGEVTFIDEIDILQKGLPLSELDLELVNVLGEYDKDAPHRLYGQLAIGNPINLSYRVTADGRRMTIPMARLVIGSRVASGDRLRVAAYDNRWFLSQNYLEWELDTTKSFGETLEDLFEAVGLAHVIAEPVYQTYPLANHAFNDSTTVLEDLSKVVQAYGLVIRPSRRGAMEVYMAWQTDQYGTVPVQNMYQYPQPAQMSEYNVVDVRYGVGTYDRYIVDLRSDVNKARSILSINNDLVIDQTMAVAVAARIASRIYTEVVSVDWRGDPALDMADDVGIYTRWTRESTAGTYKAVKREIRYDGALRETTTFVQ